ncbi:MAG: CpsB/CapC family capsule biosynthesis tyrosine phosphatase [Pseudonocardiaceae bacterium]
MDRVELHFHALPGVDDGPETVDDAVNLLWAAAAEGTTTVVATPHVRTDFVTDLSDLTERVRELQSAVDWAGLPVRLLRGGELGHDMVGRLSQGELETIAQGPPHARWLLIEAPFESIDWEFHAATDELRDRGFGIVIAHPERSADAILYGAEGLRHELERGAVGQVNAQSITGAHGPAAREAAFELISQGLLRAVSSDAHGPTRPPLLGEARAHLIEGGVPATVCNGLTGGCPRRLLARGLPSAAVHVA